MIICNTIITVICLIVFGEKHFYNFMTEYRFICSL